MQPASRFSIVASRPEPTLTRGKAATPDLVVTTFTKNVKVGQPRELECPVGQRTLASATDDYDSKVPEIATCPASPLTPELSSVVIP